MSALILSDDERWLIGLMWSDVAAVIGWPDYDIPRLRESRHESCGHGIYSRVTSKGLEAKQREWLPVPIVGGWPLYERGDLLRECSMTWARLRKWVDSLPEEVVATAKRCRDLTRDPSWTNSDEAWGYRRKSVDMAIAASTPEADLFDLLETSPD